MIGRVLELVENQIDENETSKENKDANAALFDGIQKTTLGYELRENVVLTDNDVMELLGVGATTLRKYRDEGCLSFSQAPIGDKRWYRGSDIIEFLNSCHVQAYR
jgi:hypothetical protein